METLTREILKYLENEHTKVEIKQGFMGNYYSHLIDTIFIAENFENTKVPQKSKNINKKAAELIMVCHECIHSIQSKSLHLLNTVLSNISMILCAICVFIAIFWTSPLWLKILVINTLILSVTFRLVLEVGATNGSTKLAKKVVEEGLIENVSEEDIQHSVEYINKHKWFALTQMIIDKIIFLILVLIIN